MMLSYRLQHILNWNENDLSQLPPQEDDQYEYKRSQTKDPDLGNKLSVAASAFWNSGGGIFVAGVNNIGQIDGGITEDVGNQPRRDWADQHIRRTEPQGGKYWIKTISATSSRSPIRPNHVILVVAFETSPLAPHMAYDKKYYIRAGAHSEGASTLGRK